MRYGGHWRRSILLLILVLAFGCSSCGVTAALAPPEAVAGRPAVFMEVTRIVESAYWNVDKLNPQTLLKGAAEGLESDLRHHGGSLSFKGQQMVIALNGHTKIIDLPSITSMTEFIHTFVDMHDFLQQYQRSNGKRVPWEYDAIEGMVKVLDHNSAFMPPDVFHEMQEETKGSFGGIGIRIGLEEGEVVILEPIEGTPATRVGLKQGDRIVKIDGHPTKGLTLQEAVRRMRGPVGSRVVLSVARAGAVEPEELSITRAKVDIKTVESRVLDGRIGYLKVRGFQENTQQESERALGRLAQQKIEGLILDLRNNPGGLLSQSVKVCNLFMDEGLLVVYTEGRVRNQNTRFTANGVGQYRHFPLIVLINAGSASGSEIVAGALQDLHKATILGTKSYGKGSVQTIFPLQDGSGLRLTTARYFTPNGRNIDGVGITPDIEVQNSGKDDRQLTTAHAIMKEALAVGNRRKPSRGRGTALIDSGMITDVGRGMMAVPQDIP